VKFGISYWDRDPRRAVGDMHALHAVGFSWVNIPISEERMHFDREGVRRIIDTAKAPGLEVRVSPWGVAGLFGGEGITGSINPDTQYLTMRWWLRMAEGLDPDAIYWDEPKGARGPSMITNLSAMSELPQHVYLNPKVGDPVDDLTLAHMETIGIDCYDWHPINAKRFKEQLAAEHDKPIHCWVRAFRMPQFESDKPGAAIRTLIDHGFEELAIWGYPSPGCSVLDNDDNNAVWASIASAVSYCVMYNTYERDS
jgi:hypothetical protein